MTQTINPIPTAGSNFLEVLQAFLENEDANRFTTMYTSGYVKQGGTHGTVAGLTATPDPMVAFPGGYYTTETGSITYTNNAVTFVIASAADTGDLGAYVRVPGTHYLTAVSATPVALPVLTTVPLMKVTTAGGAITAVTDLRPKTPLVNIDFGVTGGSVRLLGTNHDYRLAEGVEGLYLEQNTAGDFDFPTWADRFIWKPANFALRLESGVTAERTQQFPDKDGTFAMLSDITGSAFAAGTRLLFDNDAAPTGWTRVVSLNDVVPRIVSGARADGGSWNITGLTVASHTHDLANHQHDSPTSGSDGATLGYNAKTAAWTPGASANTYTMDRGGAVASELSVNALLTSTPSNNTSGATAPGISSDSSWRPSHRDVILASKD